MNYWVEKLLLLPHPEGGYYRETYRSEEMCETKRGIRPVATAIYFLLGKDNFSAFHRIKSDELWHFHAGDPLEVFEIDQNGELIVHLIGKDVFQTCIKANSWFASRTRKGGEYSLVSCTVSPGFDFKDFEMGERNELVKTFQAHEKIITELT